MDLLLKKLLNSLRCPICQAPVDTCNDRLYRGYNYCCAMNMDHYLILVETCFLIIETVHVYDTKRRYDITNNHYAGDNFVKTTIHIHETDAEGRIIFSFKEKTLRFDKAYFDFRKFNAENAVNRIKMILVFQ